MKKLLIVVDYQQDFVCGSLGFPEAVALEDGIVQKIQSYRDTDDIVAFTMDTHGEDYLSLMEGKNLPIPHCLKDSNGWMLYGKVAAMQQSQDPVFTKSCFGSRDLFQWLQDQEFAMIELVGVVTNICVISNAILCKTACPETAVAIDASLCASGDQALHNKTLDVLAGLQCVITNRL